MDVDEKRSVQVVEAYHDSEPPCKVKETVERLLRGVSDKYLIGLHSIVLTNASGLNRKRRREKTMSRKKKVSIRTCRGVYCESWEGEPAHIELFVDNILLPPVKDSGTQTRRLLKWLFRLFMKSKLFWDVNLSSVLYHEIGHHIHKTQAPEYGEREDIADKWKDKLQGRYLRRKYWYICPIEWGVRAIFRISGRLPKRHK